MALRTGRNIPSTNKLKLIIINLCCMIIKVLVTSLESSFGFDLKWNFTCFYFRSTRPFNRLFNVWISKRATTLIPKAYSSISMLLVHEIIPSGLTTINGSRYWRTSQVKLVEDSLQKIWSDMVCLTISL